MQTDATNKQTNKQYPVKDNSPGGNALLMREFRRELLKPVQPNQKAVVIRLITLFDCGEQKGISDKQHKQQTLRQTGLPQKKTTLDLIPVSQEHESEVTVGTGSNKLQLKIGKKTIQCSAVQFQCTCANWSLGFLILF